ncbi:5-formyltetrahydrofolate cyclo-ligase [Helicobacter sp. 12S02634-8]|nr:5-formyltetrahydrofolate cyclo-ligase [Helicobacter sp. 12S02634-8]
MAAKRIDFADKKIVRLLKKELLALGSKNILLYCPMDTEVNIYPLIYWLKSRRGIRIFVPHINGVSFKMVAFRMPLHKNQYNILEAEKSLFYWAKIDTAIIPVLGIDRSFRRVGFGKGMYDRFFQTLSYRPHMIFLSKKVMVARNIITQSHDILGDKFIHSRCIVKRGFDDRILSDRVYNIWFDGRG